MAPKTIAERISELEITVLRGEDETYYDVSELVRTITGNATMVGKPAVVTSTGDVIELRKPNGTKGDWMVADGAPGAGILVRYKVGYGTISRYTLRDPEMASQKYPVSLSPKDGDLLFGGCDYDEVPRSLYDATWAEPEIREVCVQQHKLRVLDGSPAPADALPWVANLPDSLKRHVDLHHQYPGHIPGFPAAVEAALKSSGRLRIGFLSGDHVSADRHTVTVRRFVEYTPRVTAMVDDYSPSGRKRKAKREVAQGRHIEASAIVPSVIAGDNLAEATSRWHTELHDTVNSLLDAVAGAPCAPCQGTGVVGGNEQVRPVGKDVVDAFLRMAGPAVPLGDRELVAKALGEAFEVHRTSFGRTR